MSRRTAVFAGVVAGLAGAAAGQQRADKTWNKIQAGQAWPWSTNNFWDGGVPGANDNALFTKEGAAHVVSLDVHPEIKKLRIDSKDVSIVGISKALSHSEAQYTKGILNLLHSEMIATGENGLAADSGPGFNFVLRGRTRFKSGTPGRNYDIRMRGGVMNVLASKDGADAVAADVRISGSIDMKDRAVLNISATAGATAAARLECAALVVGENSRVNITRGRDGGSRTLETQLANLGTINVETDCAIDGPLMPVLIPPTNVGTIQIAKDATLTHSNKFQNAAEINGQKKKGTISGNGTFRIRKADFLDKGNFDPNVKLVTPEPRSAPPEIGTLTIDTEDFLFDAEAEYDVDLFHDGFEAFADVLAITGTAAASGGLLDVNVLAGYTPEPGDTFKVMTFATSSPGSFSFTLDKPSWLNLEVVPTSDAVYLVVVGVPSPGAGALIVVPALVSARRRR